MEPLVLDDELLNRIDNLGEGVEAMLARLTPEQAEAVRARVLDEEEYGVIADRVDKRRLLLVTQTLEMLQSV